MREASQEQHTHTVRHTHMHTHMLKTHTDDIHSHPQIMNRENIRFIARLSVHNNFCRIVSAPLL